jgi:hypothetical protein
MKTRKLELLTEPEPCELGCGRQVAVTRRIDDGATRLSTIRDGNIDPGPHLAMFHDAKES